VFAWSWGSLFKNEELSALSPHKALPEAAGGPSLGPFSESAPAALLGSFFSGRAGNVSFLKRDPHGRALWYQRPRFMKFHTSDPRILKPETWHPNTDSVVTEGPHEGLL
jgi:hypothetical protein